jgi:outer membrane lipoprotein carrier protein
MRQPREMRPVFLIALALFLATGAGRLVAAASPTDSLLQAVERHYNQARTLSVDFTETYSVGGRNHRPESGRLLLRKPGRMRWTYTDPAGKLFISDGQSVYLYTAADNRVEKSKLKASEDMRAPLAFLLGKLDFKKEFSGFETKAVPNGTYLVAEAKSNRVPYQRVRMLIGTSYQILELTVEGRDGSVLHFSFQNEDVNPKVAADTFDFTPPPGADIVDAVSSGSGDN